MRGLAKRELNRIGRGVDQRGNGAGQVFDTGEKRGLVKKPVIERDVKAATSLGIKETMKAGGFHSFEN
jgi:hypothetical protein